MIKATIGIIKYIKEKAPQFLEEAIPKPIIVNRGWLPHPGIK